MPTRNEILGVTSLGFLLMSVGVVWLFGPIGLISCGALVFLTGLWLGFVSNPDMKKEGK